MRSKVEIEFLFASSVLMSKMKEGTIKIGNKPVSNMVYKAEWVNMYNSKPIQLIIRTGTFIQWLILARIEETEMGCNLYLKSKPPLLVQLIVCGPALFGWVFMVVDAVQEERTYLPGIIVGALFFGWAVFLLWWVSHGLLKNVKKALIENYQIEEDRNSTGRNRRLRVYK